MTRRRLYNVEGRELFARRGRQLIPHDPGIRTVLPILTDPWWDQDVNSDGAPHFGASMIFRVILRRVTPDGLSDP